jgi:serine protease Do
VITSAFAFASKPAAAVVRLPDGSQHDAKIVATDDSRMLTLLKIDAAGLPVPESAPVSRAKVGEWTIAVGKAFDPAVPNLSPGVLSAKDRIWGKAVQTDAKTSPFNYGGPLLDIRGRVLGVIVPLSMTSDEVMAGVDWYDSGIGFAVPFDQVLASFERLKAGEDLHRGSLGLVTMEPGKMFATPVIAKVRDDSPAAKAGLKAEDVIVAIDGKRVARLAEVLQALGPKYAGDTVEVTVKRGDEETTAAVTLEKPAKESILPAQRPAEQPGKEPNEKRAE